MYLAKNIRYLRKSKDWSQDFIAEKLGYKSYTTIQKWEMGTSEPPLKKLKELSLLFDVDINDLANKDLEVSAVANTPKNGYVINVLGRVAAGLPIEAIENIIDTEEISSELAKTGEFFALQIHGDSMEPRMFEKDIVIVRKQEDAENGDIVIAMVNGDDAVCKRLMKYAGGLGLVSLNSKYDPMMFSEDDVISKPVKIIGKVVEVRGKL